MSILSRRNFLRGSAKVAAVGSVIAVSPALAKSLLPPAKSDTAGNAGIQIFNAEGNEIYRGGARTEYTSGSWKIYDQNGVLRVQMGAL